MPPKQTKLEKYADLQPLIDQRARQIAQEEIAKYAQKQKFNVAKVPLHYHNGTDSPNIPSSSVVPGSRGLANITMATDGRTYRIGLNFKGSSVKFTGVAVAGGPINKRAHCVGFAELGAGTFMFVDDGDGNSVSPERNTRPFIQGSSSITINSSGMTPTFAAIASEENIIYVVDAGGGQAAVGTIVGYGTGYIDIQVQLASGWSIQGTFVVT